MRTINTRITEEECRILGAKFNKLVGYDLNQHEIMLRLVQRTDGFVNMTRTEYNFVSNGVDMLLEQYKAMREARKKKTVVKRKKVHLYRPDDVIITPAGHMLIVRPH